MKNQEASVATKTFLVKAFSWTFQLQWRLFIEEYLVTGHFLSDFLSNFEMFKSKTFTFYSIENLF